MLAWLSNRGISTLPIPSVNFLSLSELNKILQNCTNSKSIHQIKHTHQQLIVLGHDQNPFLITKLVQLYADCNDAIYAHKVFDRLSQPNVFAWTAFISLYSRLGLAYECVNCYKEMKFSYIFPDKYIYPKVLRLCAQNQWLKVGSQVHKDVIFSGEDTNIIVSNSLIDMYWKCGEIENAKRVFEKMEKRDILSWNLMISGYLNSGFLESAIDLFKFMILEGFDPDLVTYNTAIDAYFRMGLDNEVLNIFKKIKEPNIISWTTLISGYSRIGKHILSLSVFKKMIFRGKVFPDLDCISSVIVSCRHLGDLTHGREIHAYGMKNNKSNIFYYSCGPALLTMYAKCRNLLYATKVFNLMDKSDVVTWNAMIFGYADSGSDDMALDCYGKMQTFGIESDQTTICTILKVCDLKSGEKLHAHVIKAGFNLITPISNALMYMYCKSGCLKAAYSVFSNLISRDLVTWNTMIGGFSKHGLAKHSLQLLEKMEKLSTFFPNSVTFTSLLSACSHSGLVNEGVEIFDKMIKKFKIEPRVEHYACIVDLLARSGQIEEAFEFITKMDFKPDKRIWGALLAASQSHQNINIGILASEKLIDLEPEYTGHYVTLANIYDESGRWDDAIRVREMMEGRGLVKPSGYSWVGR